MPVLVTFVGCFGCRLTRISRIKNEFHEYKQMRKPECFKCGMPNAERVEFDN